MLNLRGIEVKIFLCQSYLGPRSGEPLSFPLGLAYLASMVEGEHDVYCWDPNVAKDPMKEFTAVLEKFDPDVVGLSLRNVDSVFSFNVRSYYPPFVSMVKRVKELLPYCKLVVGGAGFSLFAEEIMRRNPEIDFGIVSEGETAFYELLKNMDKPDRVKNLIVRRDGELFYTGMGEWLNFNSAPLPARHFFDLHKYADSQYSMGVQAKRGCSFNCTFCPNKFLVGNYFRLRSPVKVVDEIEHVVCEYGINSFYFVDSAFNFPFDHAKAICKEIVRRKLDISWEADFRPEFLNAEFMELAVKSGCQLFSISPDGASNGALHFLGKDFDVKTVERTVKLVKEVDGVKVGYSFFFDIPSDNRDHTLGLLRFFLRTQRMCHDKLKFFSLTRIRIYPHTFLYDYLLRHGKIAENSSLLYPIHYCTGLPIYPSNIIPDLIRRSSIVEAKIHNVFKL
ncbi:MAG: B12-binding domain-containing radical SAM protein, partial [Candidatus Bathycorpusculaceae bacterium]